MATNTWVALATYTVTGSPTASFNITGISQAYTDLDIVISGSVSSGTGNIALRFNSDTGSNYSETYLLNAGSSRDPNVTYAYLGSLSTAQSTTLIHLQNYSNSSTYRTALSRNNDGATNVSAWVSTWRNTSAGISTITFTAGGSATFAVGSTFTLYGIAAQPVATAKASGGTITYAADGYTYHAFTSSGTFTPSSNLTCEALIVAGGGGGGGAYAAGGGGAGGLLGVTGQSLTSGTGYTVTVGSSGAGAAGQYANGSAGSNSSFNSNIAIGGGYGAFGGPSSVNGGNGGSGGGAGYTSASGGTPTSGQGYTGGGTAGGGGGAGGAGAAGNGTTHIGGAGGIGSSAYSQWGLATTTGQNVSGVVYYAGGGGGGQDTTGGAGGYGGGANGSGGTNTGGDATANTGGGGGGEDSFAGGTGRGGNGGSGIVIIRYAS